MLRHWPTQPSIPLRSVNEYQLRHAIPERLRGVITTRRYTNSRLPYLALLRQSLSALCKAHTNCEVAVSDL